MRQTVAGGAAPSFNIRHYNTYVAALCTYIASMYRAPPDLDHHFCVAGQRLCRFPYRAMPQSAWRRMCEMGLPQVRDIVLEAELMFLCSARRLHGTVTRAAELLQRAREDYGSLAWMAHPAPATDNILWVDRARADELQEGCRRAAGLLGDVYEDEPTTPAALRRAMKRKLMKKSIEPIASLFAPRLGRLLGGAVLQGGAISERANELFQDLAPRPAMPCDGSGPHLARCLGDISAQRRTVLERACSVARECMTICDTSLFVKQHGRR